MSLSPDKSLSPYWKAFLRIASRKNEAYSGKSSFLRPGFLTGLATNMDPDAYRLSMDLERSGTDIMHLSLQASGRFEYNLGDAWLCSAKAMDFGLLHLLHKAEAAGSLSTGSSLSGIKFFDEMNLICALFWAEKLQVFEKLMGRYGVYERVVTDGIMSRTLATEPFSSLDACVRVLLHPTPERLAELGRHDAYAGIDVAWGSNEAMSAVFLRLGNWYLSILADARKHRDPFYEASPYVLLPMWLLALDKAHQKITGASSLPAMPLLEFARSCLSQAVLAPASEAHASFDAEYLRRSGGAEPDYERRFAPYLGQHPRIRDLSR